MVTNSVENSAYGNRVLRLHDGKIVSEEKEAKPNG
jgi:ABC-type uncharacterized transport system ATPase component